MTVVESAPAACGEEYFTDQDLELLTAAYAELSETEQWQLILTPGADSHGQLEARLVTAGQDSQELLREWFAIDSDDDGFYAVTATAEEQAGMPLRLRLSFVNPIHWRVHALEPREK